MYEVVEKVAGKMMPNAWSKNATGRRFFISGNDRSVLHYKRYLYTSRRQAVLQYVTTFYYFNCYYINNILVYQDINKETRS